MTTVLFIAVILVLSLLIGLWAAHRLTGAIVWCLIILGLLVWGSFVHVQSFWWRLLYIVFLSIGLSTVIDRWKERKAAKTEEGDQDA